MNSAEIPNFNEKEVKYFEKPPRRVINRRPSQTCLDRGGQKLEFLEETDDTSHLGPGYYKLSDPWMRNLVPVCGIVRPSSSFATSYRKDKRIDSKNNYSCEIEHSWNLKGGMFSTHRRVGSKLLKYSDVTSRPGARSSRDIPSPSLNLTHPSSTWGGFADRQLIGRKIRRHRQASRVGFSFNRQVDHGIHTYLSTTYCRVRDSNGYPLIVPMNEDENPLDIAPSGSVLASTWVMTDIYAKNGPNLSIDSAPIRIKNKEFVNKSLRGKTISGCIIQSVS